MNFYNLIEIFPYWKYASLKSGKGNELWLFQAAIESFDTSLITRNSTLWWSTTRKCQQWLPCFDTMHCMKWIYIWYIFSKPHETSRITVKRPCLIMNLADSQIPGGCDHRKHRAGQLQRQRRLRGWSSATERHPDPRQEGLSISSGLMNGVNRADFPKSLNKLNKLY